MTININPNRINTRPNTTGKGGEQRAEASPARLAAPKRAEVNYIPSPESLSTLVRNAVDALKNGARWDRGSILNLLA